MTQYSFEQSHKIEIIRRKLIASLTVDYCTNVIIPKLGMIYGTDRVLAALRDDTMPPSSDFIYPTIPYWEQWKIELKHEYETWRTQQYNNYLKQIDSNYVMYWLRLQGKTIDDYEINE